MIVPGLHSLDHTGACSDIFLWVVLFKRCLYIFWVLILYYIYYRCCFPVCCLFKKLSWTWWCIPVIPAPQEAKAGEFQVQDQPRQFNKSLSQNEIQKVWACSSLVEYLPSMPEAHGSILSTTKRFFFNFNIITFTSLFSSSCSLSPVLPLVIRSLICLKLILMCGMK